MTQKKEDYLRKKKECKRRHREWMRNNPEQVKEENKKCRDCYARKLQEEVKTPKRKQLELIESRREMWKLAKQKLAERRKAETLLKPAPLLPSSANCAHSTRSIAAHTAAKRCSKKKQVQQF